MKLLVRHVKLLFLLLCRVLTLAASSEEEKDKWLEDLTVAIDNSKMLTNDEISYLSLKSCSEFCSHSYISLPS